MMNLKQKAALKALEYVKSGMVLGLGSGSTTAFFVDLLGEALKAGDLRDIRGVPLSEINVLDLAVDGADEVDPNLNLIKGLGRALLREKVVEIHARQFVIIVDESKLVSRLGLKGPLPVEIIPFEALAHIRWLNSLGCQAQHWLEENGEPVVTDNGNYLVRCYFESGIPDIYELAARLEKRAGIVEHGLFLDMASMVIVAAEDGIQLQERSA
jgi:ribose 5-phosphate isomerase A